jgi:hypothetical protein
MAIARRDRGNEFDGVFVIEDGPGGLLKINP